MMETQALMRNSKRLFVAVNLPVDLKDKIFAAFAPLLDREKFRVVEQDKLHITLAFLGNTRVEQIPRIKEALEQVHLEPFRVELYDIGSFEDRVVFLDVWDGEKPFNALFRAVANALHLPATTFHAHITLARSRGEGLQELVKDLERLDAAEFKDYLEVWGFDLMESIPMEKGMRYKVLGSFLL